MNKKTVFTLEEIAKAWFKFTTPKYLVEDNLISLNSKEMISCEDVRNIKPLQIDYSRWIPYLVSREWEKSN